MSLNCNRNEDIWSGDPAIHFTFLNTEKYITSFYRPCATTVGLNIISILRIDAVLCAMLEFIYVRVEQVGIIIVMPPEFYLRYEVLPSPCISYYWRPFVDPQFDQGLVLQKSYTEYTKNIVWYLCLIYESTHMTNFSFWAARYLTRRGRYFWKYFYCYVTVLDASKYLTTTNSNVQFHYPQRIYFNRIL